MIQVYLTCTSENWQPWEGDVQLAEMRRMFALRPQSRFGLADSAADADVILFVEPNYYKDYRYARLLLSNDLIRRYPEKCYVLNYDDVPVGFLPGLYVGVQRQHFDPSVFRSICYLGEPNPFCAHLSDQRSREPRFLFSFRGGRSAPVRDRILTMMSEWTVHGPIEESTGWYNHSDGAMQTYVEQILDSRFVLCPRGIGVASHRLFEAMQLGRAPVIISDDWVPPEGPSWLECSIQIAECQVNKLPELLTTRANDAEQMGRAARMEWERWFSPEARVHTAFRYLHDLLNRRDNRVPDYARKWRKLSFYSPYGQHPVQKFARRAAKLPIIRDLIASTGI